MPGRVGNVLDDRAGHHDVEAVERGDLFELALAGGRDNADPFGAHQLDVAVERTCVTRVPVARDDVVAEPAKGEGEGPEPGTHLEYLSMFEASTHEQFYEPHYTDDVHAEVGGHRVLRQHSHVPLERLGLELLEQLDQVFGGVQHEGLRGSAPKRARWWQPQGCTRTIDSERDVCRAHDC
jgi:hypothetical protein